VGGGFPGHDAGYGGIAAVARVTGIAPSTIGRGVEELAGAVEVPADRNRQHSVAFGQSRVLPVWTRIIMPDGNSIVLKRQLGADTQGCARLEDEIDNHWDMLFKAPVLLLSVGAEAGTSQDEQAGQAIVDPLKLIAPMIERFMATDRGFAKSRKSAPHPTAGPAESSG
jgi:hypothetical protein